jgi:hypothetical protein
LFSKEGGMKMTFKECEEALELKKKIEQYRACKKEQASRLFVDTAPLETGRGQERLLFSIPMPYVRDIIDREIENILIRLHELGITDEEK